MAGGRDDVSALAGEIANMPDGATPAGDARN